MATAEFKGMDVERIEITSAGLFALLREDFTGLATANTSARKVEAATKALRRIQQINRIADAVTGNPAIELGYAVERLGQVLISQAQRRGEERETQVTGRRQTGWTQPNSSHLRSA